ncbi:hypothetical protein [Bradyrhizobium sp. 27S5]|uniref:hypothetical protein n=1 Tax=Bradyrhizobium sp. 27S5 TaxID=3139728 RepID=UPI0030CEBB61
MSATAAPTRTRVHLAAALAGLLAQPANAAVYANWSEACSWHFARGSVRDPTIIYNHYNDGGTYGACPGYDDTQYAFSPCNFAPNTTPAMCSNGTGPTHACAGAWTQIPLDQFLRDPATGKVPFPKEVRLTGSAGSSDWTGTIYSSFRRPGASWALSPITNSVHSDSLSVDVPVGQLRDPAGNPVFDKNGQPIPAIEAAWGVNGVQGSAWLNLILSEYCE